MLMAGITSLDAQWDPEADTLPQTVITTGWADEAVAIGYITAPSVLGLMFISALVSEYNAGYVGIPASAIILTASPIIYMGGRSVSVLNEIYQSRAKLGWTLYVLSVVPTGLALYGFTTDWGATLPLTIASAVLGTASIVAMSTYASGRSETARRMIDASKTSLNFGILPVKGGAIASLSFRF